MTPMTARQIYTEAWRIERQYSQTFTVECEHGKNSREGRMAELARKQLCTETDSLVQQAYEQFDSADVYWNAITSIKARQAVAYRYAAPRKLNIHQKITKREPGYYKNMAFWNQFCTPKIEAVAS